VPVIGILSTSPAPHYAEGNGRDGPRREAWLKRAFFPKGLRMMRVFSVALVAILTGGFATPAQQKDPPKDFTNSIGMKFVWLAPGSFLMGSPMEEEERRENEVMHKVTLTRGFYMGVYTVTQKQWQVVMGNNPSRFRSQENLPVENVSWDDCQEFVKKLREKDKKLYRLPTEAEWEYACRAGTKSPFYFGQAISTDQANYYGAVVYGNGKKGVDRRKTTPAGSFNANAFGLFDMHGNVFQWCQDWYGDYPQKNLVDPQGPERGECRVLRGGSWTRDPESCRSAFRAYSEPDYRDNDCGLRVCFYPDLCRARAASEKPFSQTDKCRWGAGFLLPRPSPTVNVSGGY
jgi:formylglycine-generating enzyme required for sulfatase activity